MADKKFTDLTEATDWARTDELAMVDTSADTSSRIDARNLVAQAYAGMHTEASGTTTDVNSSTWTLIDTFDASADTVFGATVDTATGNDITVDNGGVYEIDFNATVEWPAAGGEELSIALAVNGTEVTTHEGQHASPAASKPFQMVFRFLYDLNAGDAVSVMAKTTSGTPRTLTVVRAYLTLRRIDAAA